MNITPILLAIRQPVVIGNETIFSRIYAGYETGKVRNRVDNILQGRLAGMVIGISINLRGATLGSLNTRPLSLPGFITKKSSQTWFRLAYSLIGVCYEPYLPPGLERNYPLMGRRS